MKEELFKVLWLSKTNGAMKSFLYDIYHDDPQNKRIIFSNTNTDEVMTVYSDDTGWMLTAPIK